MNKKTLKKVKQIDILLRRKVNTLFAGSYRSSLKGQGMTFSDFREYIPGDDVRSISWNLTAKMSQPYIKTFEEEKEARILLALDISSSMDFGTRESSKQNALCLLSSVIAFSSQKNKDFLGLLLFSDDIELYIPPKKKANQGLCIIKEIYNFKRRSIKTNMEKSLSFLNKVLKKKSYIFIFSDFLNSNFEKPLQKLSQKHNIVNIIFSDNFEKTIPPLGLTVVEDIETGKQKMVDFSSHFFQKQFKQIIKDKIKKRNKQFLKSRCENIFIECQKDIYKPLIHFFQKKKPFSVY